MQRIAEMTIPFVFFENRYTKKWENWEDDFILCNPLEDSMKVLKRTEQSISMRLWRLKHKSNN